MEEPDAATDAIIADVVDACAKVRTSLGVGLLEGIYREAFVVEMRCRSAQAFIA